MDFELSEPQQQKLEHARELARRCIEMRATRADGSSTFEAEAFGALAREAWLEPWALDLCLVL
jgi:hypothetical protein